MFKITIVFVNILENGYILFSLSLYMYHKRCLDMEHIAGYTDYIIILLFSPTTNV